MVTAAISGRAGLVVGLLEADGTVSLAREPGREVTGVVVVVVSGTDDTELTLCPTVVTAPGTVGPRFGTNAVIDGGKGMGAPLRLGIGQGAIISGGGGITWPRLGTEAAKTCGGRGGGTVWP